VKTELLAMILNTFMPLDIAAKYQHLSRLTTEDKEGKIIMHYSMMLHQLIPLCTKLWSSRSEDEMLI